MCLYILYAGKRSTETFGEKWKTTERKVTELLFMVMAKDYKEVFIYMLDFLNIVPWCLWTFI